MIEHLRRLQQYTPRRTYFAVAALLAGNFTALAAPYLLKFAIDDAVVARDVEALWLPLAGIFGLQVCSSIFAYFGRWWSARAGEEAWSDARNLAHDAFHRVPPQELATPRIGDLVSRIVSDTATLKTFVQSVLPVAITVGATLLATAVVLLLVEPLLLLVVLVPLPIALGILYLLRGRILRSSRTLMERQADLQAAVTESVAGRLPIRAYGARTLFNRRVDQAGEGVRDASLQLERDQAALYPASNLILSVVLLAALASGAFFAIDGAITVGGLVVTYFYLARALGPIRSLNQVAFGWQRTTAALARIDEIVSLASEREETDAGQRLILDDVSFAWAESPTIRNVDFEAEPSSRIAVIGPSGSGKSTAVAIMLGLLRPDRGSATWDAMQLGDIEAVARAGISFLGQEPFLFRGTLRENIAFGRDVSDPAIQRAMRLAKVDFATERGGLDLQIEELGRNLSGGQKKRVALARALAGKPRLVIIDQLATDLEVELVDEILSALASEPVSVIYFGHAVPPGLDPQQIYRIIDGEFVSTQEQGDVLASG